MKTHHEIYIADNSQIAHLEDGCIDLTVTSPPYVTTKFERGQEFDYEGFLQHFANVCKELHRVTTPGGRFALNIADIMTKYRFADDELISRVPLGSDLLNIAINNGWRLLERYIWDKGYTRNFGGPLLGSYPYPMSIFNNNYFEYIYILKKMGQKKAKQSVREISRLSLDEWRKWSQQWWRIESITERINYHRAVFPVELPYRLIRMYSYKGDTVLDPYMGTGSTMIAAYLADRHSIGFENDRDCIEWIPMRMDSEISKGLLKAQFEYFLQEGVPELCP